MSLEHVVPDNRSVRPEPTPSLPAENLQRASAGKITEMQGGMGFVLEHDGQVLLYGKTREELLARMTAAAQNMDRRANPKPHVRSAPAEVIPFADSMPIDKEVVKFDMKKVRLIGKISDASKAHNFEALAVLVEKNIPSLKSQSVGEVSGRDIAVVLRNIETLLKQGTPEGYKDAYFAARFIPREGDFNLRNVVNSMLDNWNSAKRSAMKFSEQ